MLKHFLFLLFVIYFSDPIYACSCIGESTVKSAFNSSDLVVLAEVVQVEKIDAPDSLLIRLYSEDKISLELLKSMRIQFNKVTLTVSKEYKIKPQQDTTVIYTGTSGGDCGYYFKVGKKYILYAYRDKETNDYWTDICTRTQPNNFRERNALKRLAK